MVLKNLFAEQQWRFRRREEPYGRRPGRVEEGEGEMNREEHASIYTTICEMDSQW